MALHRQVTYSSRPNRAARMAHAKGERQFRTYDTSLIQPRHSRGRLIVVALAALLLVALIGFGIHSCLKAPEVELIDESTSVTFTIPEGASTADIARILQENRLVARASDFSDAVKARGVASSLKPGTYTLTGGLDVSDIVDTLVSGPNSSTLTIPEGYTLARTAAAVETATDGRISAAEFTAAASDATAFSDQFPFVAEAYNGSLEGFLFPKTYEVLISDTADSLIRKMLSQYQSETATLDYSYASAAGLSSYDVLKLASMVEREADDTNRSRVAGVFYNRLAANMALQSDATIAYLVGGDPTHDDLSIASPYNTYLNKGLPAGPICSPGLDALSAACQPEQNDYLYFYFVKNSDGSMSYFFSRTYEEHQQAIAQTQGSDSDQTQEESDSSGEAHDSSSSDES